MANEDLPALRQMPLAVLIRVNRAVMPRSARYSGREKQATSEEPGAIDCYRSKTDKMSLSDSTALRKIRRVIEFTQTRPKRPLWIPCWLRGDHRNVEPAEQSPHCVLCGARYVSLERFA
jgi:hypothetical protein